VGHNISRSVFKLELGRLFWDLVYTGNPTIH